MATLTTSQITSLAPDVASVKAARGLVKAAKWVTPGACEQGLWGECKGSGAKPYQVLVDFDSLAFKCSCPSRKHPCKHVLALMLLYAEAVGSFATVAPVWFQEWHTNRVARAERKAAKQDAEAPPDPAKQAKSVAARLKSMQAGAVELDLWMRDLVREGIADLPSRPTSLWRDTVARMADAKAMGLARRVEELAELPYSGTDWPHKVVAGLGRMRLLLDAFAHYATLSELLRADIRTALGWAQDKETVTAGERITDTWVVAGIIFADNGPLVERRVWLLGQGSGRAALVLDFSHGGRRFEQHYVLGTQFQGTAAFFPSAMPQRALLVEVTSHAVPAPQLPGASSLVDNLDRASNAAATNPLLWRLPMAFAGLRLARNGDDWQFIDSSGLIVPSHLSERNLWRIIAISGGAGVAMFGEWTHGKWYPLAAYCETWLDLATEDAVS